MEGYSFEKVSRHVYVGLTDEEALWLSSRHNANGHFHHNMTHRDYVSSSDSHSNSFVLSVTVIILYSWCKQALSDEKSIRHIRAK